MEHLELVALAGGKVEKDCHVSVRRLRRTKLLSETNNSNSQAVTSHQVIYLPEDTTLPYKNLRNSKRLTEKNKTWNKPAKRKMAPCLVGLESYTDLQDITPRSKPNPSKRIKLSEKEKSKPQEMTKIKLNSYQIANLLTENGHIVQEVCLLKEEKKCYIYTNCKREEPVMKDVCEQLMSAGFEMRLMPINIEGSVELMADSHGLNFVSGSPTSGFAVVVELPPNTPKGQRTEIGWCSSTLILEGRSSNLLAETECGAFKGRPKAQKRPDLYSGPEQIPDQKHSTTSPSNYLCLTSFHVLRSALREMAAGYTKDFCDSVFESEGQCSPDAMDKFISLLNQLMSTQKLFISLLKQNGQRIAASSIVSAEFSVAIRGDPNQDWISDGMLLKLESCSFVSKMGFNRIQTAYNEQRIIRGYVECDKVSRSKSNICNCQPLVSREEDAAIPYSKIKKGEIVTAWYKKHITMTSEARFLGEGHSGALLAQVEENSTDVLAIGSFNAKKKRVVETESDPTGSTTHLYYFVPLKIQLAKLIDLYNKSATGKNNPIESWSIPNQ